eukprot:jgi/Undpi1/942/HiC_scaffold_10.g04406.m1
MGDLVTLLGNCQNPDHAIRKQAEDALEQAGNTNMGQLLLSLVVELANEQQSEVIRQQAGLYIKVQLSAEEEAIRAQKLLQWAALDDAVKAQIKAGSVQTLHSPAPGPRSTAALIVGKLGAIELPQDKWAELLPTLMNNVTGEFDERVKVATLQALGYMCDDWEPEDMNMSQSNQILTCIVDGMRPDRPPAIRGAAARALINSLDFTRSNFEAQQERDVIMQVVCEATQCTDANVRKAAYEAIWTIATLYYDRLQAYMQPLFELTLRTIREDQEDVALNAMEFWSSLCDEELEIMDENAFEREPGTARVSQNYVKAALASLMPVVLETLSKQDEDSADDLEHWDLAKAGATCLRLIAQLVEDDVVDLMVPFVTVNIASQTNWRQREAAGPSVEKLSPLVHSAMPILIGLMRDPHVMVKDSATWTIGKICELHGPSIPAEALTPLVEALLLALKDSPRVCSKACFALHNFGDQFEDTRDEESNALSPYLSALVHELLLATQREDGGYVGRGGEGRGEEGIWWAGWLGEAVEAMNVLIKNSARDMMEVVRSTLAVVLSHLEQSFSSQVLTVEDRDRLQGLQSLLCGSLQVISIKMAKEVVPYADRIMHILVEVFKNKQAVAQEEAFMAVGALADQMEKPFINYMETFLPILIQGLSNNEEYQVCIVATGVVGDLCRALEKDILPYCQHIMGWLMVNLEGASINRDVKPVVLACLGDIALAIQGEFRQYLETTMNMLAQAQGVCGSTNGQDEDMVDYINVLRESVLEAYSGIVQGLNEENNNHTNELLPFLPALMTFLDQLAADTNKDNDVLKTAIGVVGDLAQGLGVSHAPRLRTPGIMALLNEGEGSGQDESIVSLAKWAKEQVIWCGVTGAADYQIYSYVGASGSFPTRME